jgi:DNA-binding NarL/FixJ family response regulator
MISPLPLHPRIVVVDDSIEQLQIFSAVLHNHYEVDIVGQAFDGKAAVDMVSVLHPDLVIMDVRMPEMDGLAAAATISAGHPAPAVVLMSADDSPNLRAQALYCGAQGFIFKPDFAIEIGAVLGNERRKQNVPAQA